MTARLRRLTGLLCVLWLALLPCLPQTVAVAAPAPDRQSWILIDTVGLTLTVMQGDRVRRQYENISIGRGGTTTDKRRNDDKTPLGEYRIGRVASKSAFHRFYGFNYPALDQAGRALLTGVIDNRQFDQIRTALRSSHMPPQNTPLGGHIGIHGIGTGDTNIHDDFNWTNGCVALTNEQIDDLAQWIKIGTRVVIK